MARRFDVPQDRTSDVVAITARRIKHAPLVRVKAFVTEKERKDKAGNVIGTYLSPQLSLHFDTGHIQRNAAGEPVLDDDGNERPHRVIDGYVTISTHPKSNLVSAVLPAFGFEGPQYIDEQGYLRDEDGHSPFQFAFGQNALGEDYSDITSLLDLPLYDRSNRERRKGQVECEVTSFKVHGIELIGRAVELELMIDDKGYNKIRNYMQVEDFAGLDSDPTPPPAPAKAKAPAKAAASDELTKARAFVRRTLDDSGVSSDHWPAVLGVMLGTNSYLPVDQVDLEEARAFSAMTNKGKDLVPIQQAYDSISEGEFPPEDDTPW